MTVTRNLIYDSTLNLELFFFLAAREENYSHYTIELVASNGRLRYEQGGSKILWQSVIANSTCKGYQILNPVPEMIASDLDHSQWQVADQLSASLAGREARICSGQEALRTLDVLNQIVQNFIKTYKADE